MGRTDRGIIPIRQETDFVINRRMHWKKWAWGFLCLLGMVLAGYWWRVARPSSDSALEKSVPAPVSEMLTQPNSASTPLVTTAAGISARPPANAGTVAAK